MIHTLPSSPWLTPTYCQFLNIYYITLHYITLHYITSHHITSHHITSHHITSHHIYLLRLDVGDWYSLCKWRQIGNHFLGSVLRWFQNVCHFYTSKQNNIRIIVSYSNVFSRTLKLLVKCSFNICDISLCKGWRHFLWIFNQLLIGWKLRHQT